jgi:DNA polymerase elongation subunit (family B)
MEPRKCTQVKGYRGDYANPDKLPHAHAAEVMMRNGLEVCKGDKIEFVYTLPKPKKGENITIKSSSSKSERAYDIDYFEKSDDLIIDAAQYIDLLEQPISQFMIMVAPVELKLIFEEARRDLKNLKNRQNTISSFYSKQ